MTKSKILVILIGIIILIIMGYFLTNQTEAPSPINEAKIVAEDWIQNDSPTYTFDGFDLEYISGEKIDEDGYEFVFNFKSKSSGYGDRNDQMSAQVITPHTIQVYVYSDEIVNAVIDNSYSEFYQNDDDIVYSVPVFFVDSEENFIEVQRIIESEPTPTTSILELIKGLTAEEVNEGLFTNINPETELNSLEVLNNVALVDFNEKLDEGVAGSAMVMSIRGQIEKTLLEFPNIDSVVISINGETEEIIQP